MADKDLEARKEHQKKYQAENLEDQEEEVLKEGKVRMTDEEYQMYGPVPTKYWTRGMKKLD